VNTQRKTHEHLCIGCGAVVAHRASDYGWNWGERPWGTAHAMGLCAACQMAETREEQARAARGEG